MSIFPKLVSIYRCRVTLTVTRQLFVLTRGGKFFFLSGNMGQRLEIFLGWFSYARASQWLSVIYHIYELLSTSKDLTLN